MGLGFIETKKYLIFLQKISDGFKVCINAKWGNQRNPWKVEVVKNLLPSTYHHPTQHQN